MNFFSLVSTLILLTAVSSYINYRYIRLSATIDVMLVALVGSAHRVVQAGTLPLAQH